jgi:hypothetical protein
MQKTSKFRIDVILSLILALAVSACCSITHERWPTKMDTYRAVLSDTSGDGNDRLKAFDTNLKAIVGVSNLETRYIGCSKGCDQLNQLIQPTELWYIFFQEHPHHFRSFTGAWHRVQQQMPQQDFSLRFDAVPPNPPACLPMPCYSIPSCTSTDGCDKNKNVRDGCQPC